MSFTTQASIFLLSCWSTDLDTSGWFTWDLNILFGPKGLSVFFCMFRGTCNEDVTQLLSLMRLSTAIGWIISWTSFVFMLSHDLISARISEGDLTTFTPFSKKDNTFLIMKTINLY